MTDTNTECANDRTFCWEQVSRANRLFRISRVFATRDSADKLLPLYALFSVVEQIGSTLSDPDVASSKLNWWRNEVSEKNRVASQHPILRELNRSGAASRLPEKRISELFDGAEYRMSATAPTDMGALRKQCVDIYRPQLELELSVTGAKLGVDDYCPGLLACNGLFQLICESARGTGQGRYWWVPLNSLARHGVSRGQILTGPDSQRVTDLLTDVLTEGISWGEAVGYSLKTPAVDLSPARHIFAISGLYVRKLKGLVAVTPSQYSTVLAKLSPADLLSAWNSARRLK